MTKHPLKTKEAPQAIGTYSQAVKAGNTTYFSGQIGLDPLTMEMAEGFEAQAHRVFANVRGLASAAGGTLDDIVKLTVFLSDMSDFAQLNEIMAHYFTEPYPARSAVAVSQLPRAALIEVDAVLVN